MTLEDPNTDPNEYKVTFRSLELPELTGDESFSVSDQTHLQAATKIASSYIEGIKNRSDDPRDLFINIGKKIGEDFPFTDQGGGCNTLAGQLDRPSPNNRDCKLPTFIFGLTQSMLGNGHCEIIYLSSNPAHPYVRKAIDGQYIYGHYTKPSPGGSNKSQFELLHKAGVSQLENFESRGRTNNFEINLKGMQMMDELFIDT